MAAQCLAHPPDQTAIVDLRDGRVDVSYGDLAAMVDRVAGYLSTVTQPGDRVGVLLSQSPWCAAVHLACWKIGRISVPLFQLFKAEALASRIEDSGLQVVLTDAGGLALIRECKSGEAGQRSTPLRGRSRPLSAVLVEDVDGPPTQWAEVTHETPAVLIYTSGTTGKPKGALHGHGVLDGHIPGVVLSHDHLGQPGDCLWTPADWAWIGGLFDVLMPGLALGVPVVASSSGKFSVDDCLMTIAEGRVRNVFFPPTALRMLKADGRPIPGLRTVASGGEPLGAEMLAWGQEAFGLTINEFYGQTECNMIVSSCAADFAPEPGCMGRPVPGFEVQVIDDTGSMTTREGDIAVRRGAPSMMLEYWNNPEATSAKFRGDWMLTGDRGVWEGDHLRFVGREDDVITSSGYRIGPAEIEDCLLTHPGVVTCGVVGKPDALRTEIVKAYVVRAPDMALEARDLQDWVKGRLAAYSYPREVEFVDALPMTVTGKVIRQELKRRACEEALQ